MTKATLPAAIRPLLETRLPDWLDVRWFASKDEALAQYANRLDRHV
jgi:hypothetical protein